VIEQLNAIYCLTEGMKSQCTFDLAHRQPFQRQSVLQLSVQTRPPPVCGARFLKSAVSDGSGPRPDYRQPQSPCRHHPAIAIGVIPESLSPSPGTPIGMLRNTEIPGKSETDAVRHVKAAIVAALY